MLSLVDTLGKDFDEPVNERKREYVVDTMKGAATTAEVLSNNNYQSTTLLINSFVGQIIQAVNQPIRRYHCTKVSQQS